MAKQAKKKADSLTEKGPRTIADLKPADWNPREIDIDAAATLQKSIGEFGDLSGIVYHRDGYLITGHQRIDALRKTYGEKLPVRGGAICLPDGRKFPVRIVDWSLTKAKAANLIANSPLASGQYTPAADGLVQDIADTAPDLVDMLRLNALTFDEIDDMESADGLATAERSEAGPEKMELLPYEHYDYILILTREVRDWEFLCEKLGIKKVNASPIPGKKKIGLGRAIDAKRLIALLDPDSCSGRTAKVTLS